MKHSAVKSNVVVIGGGHAGCEAALASARFGVDTVLVTHQRDRIGEMSCNPAIGGLGKGHLVREIDALDGAMGKVADKAGIQFRLLNRRKGPAVQGPRAQCDRALYKTAMQAEITKQPNLTVVEDEVVDLIVKGAEISGVELKSGGRLLSNAVVVTTGTFLRGVIHLGTESRPGGRIGDDASVRLAERFDDLGVSFGRLKTGTPPRIPKSSIDWDSLPQQPGDDEPTFFSFFTKGVQAEQVACAIAHTNEETHEIISSNIDKSAMYSGRIEGVGPRYCPSIEDKVVRFADKTSHQIFLEPEGLTSDLIYPNGISTSLPIDVQIDYVRSIAGLENAEIAQPGYAIEYDYVDPRSLDRSLRVKSFDGLYLAGQINGTTGYEEAGAQGLVAGLNAAAFATEQSPFSLDRADGYIGVMIDDLVTQGVTEPYRMFTSRAEYRLTMRADNADQRLTKLGRDYGCVGDQRWSAFSDKMERLERGRRIAKELVVSPNVAAAAGVPINRDGVKRNMLELLGYKGVSFDQLSAHWPELDMIDEEVRQQLANDALYAGYLDRQSAQIAELRRSEQLELPTLASYRTVDGLSNEFASKLDLVKPATLGQASRIEGCTPAALTVLLSLAKRFEAKSA